MKKALTLSAVLLALALAFTGCASTPATTNTSTTSPAWLNVTQAKTTLDPELIKQSPIDDLFDNVEDWPQNQESIPVIMAPAEDAELWYQYKAMAEDGASIAEQEALLINWYDTYGFTPDFFGACHNYYFSKALYLIDFVQNQADKDIVFGYLDRVFDVTMHGFLMYPDRLDLWCGYVHAANSLGDYENAKNCCYGILGRLDYNSNYWYWTCNEPFYHDEGEKVMEDQFISIMHDYISVWLDDDKGPSYAGPIGEILIEYFPTNSIALNDLALANIYCGYYDDALELFERAHEADPSDHLVTMNLAYTYEELGYYEEAKACCDEVIASGDMEYISRALSLSAELVSLMNPGK